MWITKGIHLFLNMIFYIIPYLHVINVWCARANRALSLFTRTLGFEWYYSVYNYHSRSVNIPRKRNTLDHIDILLWLFPNEQPKHKKPQFQALDETNQFRTTIDKITLNPVYQLYSLPHLPPPPPSNRVAVTLVDKISHSKCLLACFLSSLYFLLIKHGKGKGRGRLGQQGSERRLDTSRTVIISKDTRFNLNYARIMPTLTLVCLHNWSKINHDLLSDKKNDFFVCNNT